MLRDQFSYWLRITPEGGREAAPEELEGILATLSACDAAGPDSPLEARVEDGGISAAVPDDVGTIEESYCIRESIERAAEAWPGFKFVLDEIGETDKARQLHLEWAGGKRTVERWARLVPADAYYDGPTAEAMMEFLLDGKPAGADKDALMREFQAYMQAKEDETHG